MRERAGRTLNLVLGLGLSCVFLYLAFRGEDWGTITEQLNLARYEYFLPIAVLGVYVLYVRSQRWRLLLASVSADRPPMMPIFSASAVGFMANMLLPFRVGEIARPVLVSRHTGIPLSAALATVLVERVLDLGTLFTFALWLVLSSPVPETVRQLTWAAGVAAVVLAVGISVVAANRRRYQPLLDRLWSALPGALGPQVKHLADEFFDALSGISDPWVMAQAVAWSFYVWFLIAIGFALGFPATSLDVPFISGGVTVATLVALAVSIPSAPAFVGQFEWGCKLALSEILGVDGAKAAGYAILVHSAQFITQVALGLVFVVREGLSFSELGAMAKRSGSD